MTIFVTGATGLIGSHLCRKLIHEGHEVIGLSHNRKSLITQTEANYKEVNGDIRDINFLQDLFRSNKIDTVFHLAAHIPNASELDYDGVNKQGTINLLRISTNSNVKNFIYASSMSVYSEPPSYLPVDEKHPINTKNKYGLSKLYGECYCDNFARRINVIILRYSSVYGYGGKLPLVVANFAEKVIHNLPIEIIGDGNQSRDFIYVADAVKGTYLAWRKGESELYNIGSGQETTILELAKSIIKVFNSKSKIVFVNKESEYPYRFYPDISKARRELGFMPMGLEEGLALYKKEIVSDRK